MRQCSCDCSCPSFYVCLCSNQPLTRTLKTVCHLPVKSTVRISQIPLKRGLFQKPCLDAALSLSSVQKKKKKMIVRQSLIYVFL